MKRAKLVLIVLTLVFAGIQQADAQSAVSKLMEHITLGVKVEGNGSIFNIQDNPTLKATGGAGGAVGNFIRFNITKHFAIQEDIMFVYYSSNLESNGIKDKFQYFGTEVPIYFMGQWKTVGGGRFYVGAGPYFGLGFIGKYKDSDINVFKKYDGEKAGMKRLSNGAAAIIGYELPGGFQLNASYKYGLNVLDRDKDVYKMSPQSFSVGIGYSF